MDAITEEELTKALELNCKFAVGLGGSLASDLESAGREAIVRAMQTYERSRGEFCAYARAFVRKAIILEHKNALTAVRLPVNLYQAASCVEISAIANYPAPEPAEDFSMLYKAMEGLPEGQRAALTAYYFEAQTLREIGATLGITTEGARQRIKTALKSLEAKIKKIALDSAY